MIAETKTMIGDENWTKVQGYVTKYVPGGLTGSDFKATQTGFLFGKDQLGIGSGSYWASLKTTFKSKSNLGPQILDTSTNNKFAKDTDHWGSKYILLYGLTSKSKPSGLADKGTWMQTAKAFAFLGSTTQVHSKSIGILLLKFNGGWVLATDLARYLNMKAGDANATTTPTLKYQDDKDFSSGPKYATAWKTNQDYLKNNYGEVKTYVDDSLPQDNS